MMPWKIGTHKDCPAGKPHAVINKDTGRLHGCHESRDKAAAQMAALYAKEPGVTDNRAMDRPHEGLIRLDTGISTRSTEGEMPTLTGRFAAPGEWTEIRSVVEGHFMERFAPGAFLKTISESKEKMRVLFHHGRDPRLGMQVLGKIRALEPDTSYEVPLFDTPEVRSLLPGLEAGQYGSSFKFDVIQEDPVLRPERSEWNPKGIPEVTITEARVMEFGPTPLPAYPSTSAGLRSLTDEILLAGLQDDPERLQVFVGVMRAAALQESLGEPEQSTRLGQEPQHSAEPDQREEEKPSWLLE